MLMLLLFFLDFIDKDLFVIINQRLASPSLDSMMIFLSNKSTFIPLYLLFIGLVIKKFRLKFWMPLLLILIAFGLADSISSKIVKPLFSRTRPAFEASLHARLPDGLPGGKFGFVSSHAANAFAVFGMASALLGFARRQRLALMYIASAIAYSRVYLGFHYLSDVVFGAFLGLGIVWLLLKVWRKWLQGFTTQEIKV